MNRKEREQQVRRGYIVDAAITTFAKVGYENASMNEIAKLSEFTKSTLYQYFDDKADLYLSVVFQLYKDFSEQVIDLNYKQTNGLDIIRQLLFTQFEYYKSNKSTFRVMYDINTVQTSNENSKLKEIFDLDLHITETIKKYIEMGQRDGTICKTKDALATTHNLKFMITALFDKLVVTKEGYTKLIGKSLDELAEELIEFVLCGIGNEVK